MARKSDISTKVAKLRRKAEELLRVTKHDVEAIPVKKVQQLVHELQVHQIELEMQNDELRRTQVKLEVARDHYAVLYDSAPTGYLTLDFKGMIRRANLPACTLLGKTRKDLLGQQVIRFVAVKDQATFQRHLLGLLNTGGRDVCEVDLVQRDGISVSVQFESVLVQDKAGQHTLVFTALQNITERRRTEALLWEQRLELERQRSLEQRVRLSHDLHDGILQSLFSIGLNIETCKLDISKNPDRAAATLSRSIGVLNAAMVEVRTFMKELESEPPPAIAMPAMALPMLDLPGLLSSMAEELAQLHGKQVRVSSDGAVAAGLWRAQGFEILKLAKEALSNSFRHAQAPLVFASLRRVNGAFRLTVRDNGRGFSVEGKSEGHGLLNVAARAGRLGGTLSVQSMPAKGTRVVFDLPAMSSKEFANS
jgi:PAS domain S-box-containing protein